MLIAISISLTTHHIQRVAGAAVDAATTVNAVGVAEEAVLCVFWRVEAEGASLGAETAFAFPCHDRCSFRVTSPRLCGR